MSTLYLLALVGVCVALLAVMGEAIVSVSRTPRWTTPRRRLMVVEAVERRTQNLPFVGTDRRKTAGSVSEEAPADRKYGT